VGWFSKTKPEHYYWLPITIQLLRCPSRLPEQNADATLFAHRHPWQTEQIHPCGKIQVSDRFRMSRSFPVGTRPRVSCYGNYKGDWAEVKVRNWAGKQGSRRCPSAPMLAVIASEAKQSPRECWRLRRRCAPRNDIRVLLSDFAPPLQCL